MFSRFYVVTEFPWEWILINHMEIKKIKMKEAMMGKVKSRNEGI